MQRASIGASRAGLADHQDLQQQMVMGGFGPAQLQNLANHQQQMNLSHANPGLDGVMNLDPIDGRDTRGRGASRDASNPRIAGLQGSSSSGYVHQARGMAPVASRGSNAPQLYCPIARQPGPANGEMHDQLRSAQMGQPASGHLEFSQILQNQRMQGQNRPG